MLLTSMNMFLRTHRLQKITEKSGLVPSFGTVATKVLQWMQPYRLAGGFGYSHGLHHWRLGAPAWLETHSTVFVIHRDSPIHCCLYLTIL